MDDLFELFNDNNEELARHEKTGDKQKSPATRNETSSLQPTSSKTNRSIANAESWDTSLTCEFSKIRITNRIIGRDRLKQIISEELSLSFTNICLIAALPKTRLEAMEDEGVNDLCTIAVVTKRGGTLVSKSNGAAFCVLELGTFVSSSEVGIGTMASLFLFGEAYSKFVANKSLRNGSVILLMCPKVFPSKPGGDTTVSFSIRDSDRMMLIGTAKDFGVCTGKSFRGIKCRRLIDLRRGQYCRDHKIESMKSPSSATMKLREQMTSYRVAMPPSTRNPGNSDRKIATGNIGGITSLFDLTSQHRSRVHTSKHTSIGGSTLQSSNGQSIQSFLKLTNAVTNPYTKKQNDLVSSSFGDCISIQKPEYFNSPNIDSTINRKPRVSQPKQCAKRKIKTDRDLLGGLLSAKVKREKPRTLASIIGGKLNGQVFVPPPSALLFGKYVSTSNDSKMGVRLNQNVDEKKISKQYAETVLSKQRELASERDSKLIFTPDQPILKQKHVLSKNKSSPTSVGDALFGTMIIDDLEKAMSATSKFSNEAMAERYAQSRMVVTELEKKEALTEKRKKNDLIKVVKTEWLCTVCNKKTLYQPKDCIRAKHTVRMQRSLSKQKKEGTKSSKAKVKNGEKEDSLRLGSGIAWSGYRGGSYTN